MSNPSSSTTKHVVKKQEKGPEAEKQLQRKLEERFLEAFEGRNYTQWHRVLSDHIADSGVGHLQGM